LSVFALGAAGLAATAASLHVPLDSRIPVALTQKLSSSTAHVGDSFTFATTKAITLGTLTLPKGTPGHGRLADVRPAQGKSNGVLALQVDSLDLPDGNTVWVNIDPSKPPRGHYADKRNRAVFLPLPILIGGSVTTATAGNMILEPGTPFTVVTILPRSIPAPLLTATPAPPPPAGTPAPNPATTTQAIFLTPAPSAPVAPHASAAPAGAHASAAPPAAPATAVSPLPASPGPVVTGLVTPAAHAS
jgi:hypothetical protein